jgi:glycosyltransferase involved in cell wall biosynthesis
MILGGWDHAWGNGRAAYAAACRQALELDVMPDFLTPGAVPEVEKYYAAFDVFLNTSVYEGLSVATLEAIQAGCPIVSADAGGNREALPQNAFIVHDSSDIAAYVSGIEKVLAAGRRSVPARPADSDLVPRLWCSIGRHACSDSFVTQPPCSGPLFLTDNLNLGGAARSLVNLLCRLPGAQRPWLGIINEVNHQSYLDELENSGVHVFSLNSGGSYLDRVERILGIRRRLGADTLVFWNVDARIKLLLAKILPRETARLVDVSPGPWLFEDLQLAAGMQRRIVMDYASYFERIDHFVAKYSDGAPPGLALPPGKLTVIPNGVPDLSLLPEETSAIALPTAANPELVIGTCCRILPSKRFEYFVDMMAEMNRRLPGVTMIVVGAANRRYKNYWHSIIERASAAGVSNLHFVGQQADVIPYLRMLRVFVMLGADHGCPNASLEAMSLALPIVTARHGGAVEQVQDGINGFLVSDEDPREMAHRVRMLLMNVKMRERFGAASRRIANETFSMDLMVGRYTRLFGLVPAASVPKRKNTMPAMLPALVPATTTEGDRTCVN